MRSPHVTFGFGAIGLILISWATGETQEPLLPTRADLTRFNLVRPILEKHCSSCHGPKKQEGQLDVLKLDPDLIRGADAEHWQEVLDRVNAGTMPPKARPQPSGEERQQLTSWLTNQLKVAADIRHTTGGQTILRRMTRYEYNNTLRDLLGIDLDYAKDLPPEAAAELGFQNNSNVLVTSLLHIDHYQKIANKALLEAFGSKVKPVPIEVSIEPQEGISSKVPKKKKGKGKGKGPEIKSTIPHDGEGVVKFGKAPVEGPMLIKITAWARRSPRNDSPQMFVEIGFVGLKGRGPGKQVGQVSVDAVESAPHIYEFPIRAEDYINGPRPNYLLIRNQFDRGTSDLSQTDFPELHIGKVELYSPYFKIWPPETRTQILFPSPTQNDEKVYAQEVIEKFMRRAYRRPVTSEEVQRMHALFVKLRADQSFEPAMVNTLSAVLSSPGFLLLSEPAPNRAAVDKARKLNDYELASRLSYFLWSTMPDDTLFALAKQGKLQEDAVLREQVKRMLEDPKSQQFSQRFVTQWLDLDSVNRVAVNPEYFPNFNDGLKPAMRQETILFFDTILHEDLSCFTLLDSEFAILNAGLAKHYGIPGIAGDRFRKVVLKPEHHRGGILTHASILTGNSSGDDTHPVKRGVWLLERLLNDPPPPPPPEVPTLAQSDKKGVRLSLTEKLLVHRQESACMNCHKKIDPWGLAFENYDGVGVWRASRKGPGGEVNASTELPDGPRIDGVAELRQYLLKEKRERFAETVVGKILSYALWRNLEFSDRKALGELTQAFKKNNYQLRPLIAEIVLSETFRSK